MSEVVIKFPGTIHKEYVVDNSDWIDSLLKELEKIIRLSPSKTTDNDVWLKSLSTISTWTSEDIEELGKARRYINQWQPQQSS